MAKYSGLSAKKLRYYDEMGILSPRHKDPKSGYRYYTFSEFEKSILLKTMRDLDYSLDRIKKEFAQMSTERYLELLKIRNEKIAVRLQQLQQMQKFLGARILELSMLKELPKDRCFVVPIQSFRGLVYPVVNQSREGLRQQVREIEKEHNDGASIILILRVVSKENIEAGRPTDYSSLLVMLSDYTGYEDRIRIFPEQLYAACYCLSPKHKSIKDWQNLLEYIDKSGYEICGDAVKKIMIEQGLPIESDGYGSIIGIPVRKRDSEEN